MTIWAIGIEEIKGSEHIGSPQLLPRPQHKPWHVNMLQSRLDHKAYYYHC